MGREHANHVFFILNIFKPINIEKQGKGSAMNRNIILYVTDVHGNKETYERVLEEALKREVAAVIIGGDISPTGFLDISIQAQRDFLEGYLIPRFEDFRKHRIEIFIMMGNDDFSVNLDLLYRAERKGIVKLMHGKVHRLGSLWLVGYSCINPIPFMLKDWERSEEEIRKDLERLKGMSSPGKTVYAFHAPPFGTRLDVLFTGEHKGSKSVKEFIEKEQPFLTLHGHIHESPDVSGVWKQSIGNTLSINPGDRKIVMIDLDDLEKTRIIGE